MALACERWNSTVTPPPPPPEEGAEVEGAPEVEGALPPASGLRRTGPVGSPEATVTAETRAWRGGESRVFREREREEEGGREGVSVRGGGGGKNEERGGGSRASKTAAAPMSR